MRGPELTVIVVIPLLVVALTLFLNRTKYGLAIRASAANADAARLSGINIKKMSTIVWVIAGGLAATAAMLFGPLNPQGASATGVGPGLLLRVLAAALIGGMVSMPLALGGWHRHRDRREPHHLQLQRPARAARPPAVRPGARDCC